MRETSKLVIVTIVYAAYLLLGGHGGTYTQAEYIAAVAEVDEYAQR